VAAAFRVLHSTLKGKLRRTVTITALSCVLVSS